MKGEFKAMHKAQRTEAGEAAEAARASEGAMSDELGRERAHFRCMA